MGFSRRSYLTLLGGTTLGLAGCGTGGGVSRTTYDASSVSVTGPVTEYLSDVSNFDGSAVDLTDRDQVEVLVGTNANSGYYGYTPSAIKISTGTTVVWTWTGRGAAHNVVERDEAFRSGPAEAGEEITFEHTFEDAGTFPYYCTPHLRYGMKGVVIVA